MYYVVTGAAGFIGSNLVKALNERGETDIIAVDNLTRADKFLNLAIVKLPITSTSTTSWCSSGGGVRGRDRGGAAPGRLLRHHGDRRALHDGEQLPLLGGAARLLPGRGSAAAVCLVRLGLRRRQRVSRRTRHARRRSTSTAIPSSCSTRWCAAACPMPTARSRVSAISMSTARARQHKGRMASVAFHFFNQYPKRETGQAVPGLGRLCRRRAEARLRLGRGRGQGEYAFPRAAGSLSGIFNLGTGRAQSFNDVAVATINACLRAEGQAALTLAEIARARHDRVHRLSRMRSRASTRAIPRPTTPRCAAPAIAQISSRWKRACRLYGEQLL